MQEMSDLAEVRLDDAWRCTLMIRRKMAAVGIGVATIVATLAILAAPASAHDVDVYHGYDHGWVWSHNEVHVDDVECDGHSSYVEYYVSTIGGLVYYNLYDHTCQNLGEYRNHYPQQVTQVRICEAGEGCSAWRYT
jgi:hypothetical protein